jgi:hypothetical protein
MEETIGYRRNVPACAVCGKNRVAVGSRASIAVAAGLNLVVRSVSRPSRRTPDPYVRRLGKIDYFRYLSDLEKPLVKG